MTEEFIQFERTGTVGKISARGEVDLSNSPQLRKTILGALRVDEHIIVDLSQVSYIDSSGIAALVEGLQMANKKDKTFSLQSPSEQVMSILELARLDTVFSIE
ncbi:STAS domain-containing protein [Marinicella sp. W31]|uniref:STAS domain-containing protein n=1 Tax=Marinicella sp. W31 TaxID=3023713 RepID=UPI003756BF72